MTQAFVYHWQELSTNKWYIGSRTRNGCHPKDGYLTSSKYVKPLIIANPNNWKRTIIAVGDPKDMKNFEALLLKMLDARNDPTSYNMHNGDGKFTTEGMDIWTEEKRKEISKRFKGRKLSTETKQKISEKKKGNKSRTGMKIKPSTSMALSQKLKGRTFTPEWKQKLSEANKGKKWTPEFREKMMAARKLKKYGLP